MLKSSKNSVRLLLRKAFAFLLAYCFFATSVWSMALPLEGRRPGYFSGWSTSPYDANLMRAIQAMSQIDPYKYRDLATSHESKPLLTNASFSSPMLYAASAPHDDDDGQSSHCTIHSSQPKSDGDDDDGRDHGYDGHRHYDYRYGDDDHPHGSNPPITASGNIVFGPETYVRTQGKSDDFYSTITVPAWIAQPFYLHVVNGDSSGNHRVQSGSIDIDGISVLKESDFNEQVASADCVIHPALPSSQLHVDLDSKPGSQLTVTVLGQSRDHTPPVLTIAAPANGSVINTPQAHLDVKYQDLPGAGEPAASGVDVSTLQVLLDGVDRTSLFTKLSNEATADLPASLALSQGSHTLTASIKDFAGNKAQATSQFQVKTNTTPPTIQILQPVAGSYINNATQLIQIAYSDSVGINTATLKVVINGVDQSAKFTKTASGATAT